MNTLPSRSLPHLARVFRRFGVVTLALLAPACGKSAFPSQLFAVEASSADYPVMMSRTPAPTPGRVVRAESGTEASVSQSPYSIGNSTVFIRQSTASASELPASAKLAAQVHRSDKWLRVERAVFKAEDFSTYGSASAERKLSIEGTVHQ